MSGRWLATMLNRHLRCCGPWVLLNSRKSATTCWSAAFLINPLLRQQTLTELATAELGYEGSSLDDLDTDELISRAPEIMAVISKLHANQPKELEADA